MQGRKTHDVHFALTLAGEAEVTNPICDFWSALFYFVPVVRYVLLGCLRNDSNNVKRRNVWALLSGNRMRNPHIGKVLLGEATERTF